MISIYTIKNKYIVTTFKWTFKKGKLYQNIIHIIINSLNINLPMKFIDIKTINFHLLFFVYQRIINFPKLPNTSKMKANTHQSFKIYLNFISTNKCISTIEPLTLDCRSTFRTTILTNRQPKHTSSNAVIHVQTSY